MTKNHEVVFDEWDRIHRYIIETQLDRQFFPFSKATERVSRGKQSNGLDSQSMHGCQIRLGLPKPNGRNVPLRLLADISCSEDNGLGIVPNHPEFGYVITGEDFKLATRRKKLLESIAKYEGYGINENAPIKLKVDLEIRDLILAGIATGINLTNYSGEYYETPHYINYTQGMQGLLRRLRLQVTTANTAFETRIFNAPNIVGPTVYNDQFYPLDTGPLPAQDHETFSMEDDGSDLMIGSGHPLCFKDEDAEIFGIGMKFVLAPQRNGHRPV